jgi:hypothetical protein
VAGVDQKPSRPANSGDRFAFARKWAANPGPWLILASLVLAFLTVRIGTAEPKSGEEPNRLATSLLQGITLVFSTYGSYALGKLASREAAEAQVRQSARSAFRRVRTLYMGLGRLSQKATSESTRLISARENASADLVRLDLALASLDKLFLMAEEQRATGVDALEDWRDLAPDEVGRIENEIEEKYGVDDADTEEE